MKLLILCLLAMETHLVNLVVFPVPPLWSVQTLDVDGDVAGFSDGSILGLGRKPHED